jgi:hypothetical protein
MSEAVHGTPAASLPTTLGSLLRVEAEPPAAQVVSVRPRAQEAMRETFQLSALVTAPVVTTAAKRLQLRGTAVLGAPPEGCKRGEVIPATAPLVKEGLARTVSVKAAAGAGAGTSVVAEADTAAEEEADQAIGCLLQPLPRWSPQRRGLLPEF